MKCVLLFLTVYLLVIRVECARQSGNVKVKTKEEAKNDVDFKLDDKSHTMSSFEKRQLDERIFRVPKGKAYSYTHFVQSHGPTKKIIHPSSSYHREAGDNHGPNDEAHYGPIYVTARPVLPVEGGNLQPTQPVIPNHQQEKGYFPYPLFTPNLYDDLLEKGYSIPVQVVYRMPYQKEYEHTETNDQSDINSYSDYNQLAFYPIHEPFISNIQERYADRIVSTADHVTYPFHSNGYGVAGDYIDPIATTHQNLLLNNAYNSEESR